MFPTFRLHARDPRDFLSILLVFYDIQHPVKHSLVITSSEYSLTLEGGFSMSTANDDHTS